MNLGQLRASVRAQAGESRKAGIWTDEDINRWFNESQNEHAQRALSVRKTVHVSSLYGVQEYVLPDDFGELMAVRFAYQRQEGNRGLTYVTKQLVQDWGYGNVSLGDSEYYYYYQDSEIGDIIGLFPVPNKPRIFENVFDESCQKFVPMLTDRDARYPVTPTEFSNLLELDIDAELDELDEIPAADLDPCIVWCGQVDLYLRRRGHPYPGNIYLTLGNQMVESTDLLTFRGKSLAFRGERLATDVGFEDGIAEHVSHQIPAAFIDARPNWIPFDLTQYPLEVTEHNTRWEMRLRGDGDYLFPFGVELDDPEFVLNKLGGEGVLVGVDPNDIAYFRLNRLRNDIEVEYYRNYCDPMEEDTDIPEVPKRYLHTLRKQVLEKMYLKGGHDMALAERWGAEARSEMSLARTQAVIPTIGDRLELRSGRNRLQPNFQWDNKTRTARVRL